jgi:3-oxoadipate enol-lactonase
MLNLERDGVRIYYRVEGDGSPILLVHSATSTGDHDWRLLVRALSGSYRCVVPDLRSHGQSDHAAQALGLDAVLEDLRALIEKEGLGRPHVIGFSFGAEVALELEVRHPGSVASLTLLSPAIGHPTGVPRSEKLAAWWPRSLRELHIARHGPDQWSTILAMLSADAAGRGLIPDLDLARIACPMLLVVGTADAANRIAQARHLASVNPLAELVTIEGAGHAALAAAPELVVERIVSFLSDAQQLFDEDQERQESR